MGGNLGLVDLLALFALVFVIPVLPVVLVPTAFYLFTESLAAEFAFTMTWWFVVGVNAALFLAGVWQMSQESIWYLAPVSLAVMAAGPIKRKWKPPPPLPEPPSDDPVPPLGHL
jgi:hypothetical protein